MKNKKALVYLLMSAALFLCACDNAERSRILDYDKSKKTQRSYDQLQIDIDKDNIKNAAKAKMAQNISDNAPISIEELTALFITEHLNTYNQEHKTSQQIDAKVARQHLSSLLHNAARAKFTSIQEFKNGYEDNLVNQNGRDLIVNRDHLSLFNVAEDFVLQPYSATSLFFTLLQMSGNENLKKQNLVVIFEPGHMLPGVLVQEGGLWLLYGIETLSSASNTIKRYGRVNKIAAPIRIVSFDYFMLFDVFGANISNKEEAVKKALELTATKYEWPLEATEKLVAQLKPANKDDAAPYFNNNPFVVSGPITVGPGNIDRKIFDIQGNVEKN